MNSFTAPFIAYFEKALKNLPKIYKWEIPKKLNFQASGNIYEDNINLKNNYHDRWNNSNKQEKEKLAYEIVSIWGGVKNNKSETLQKYICNILSEKPQFPLKGVASYSKIYSIVDPSKYAIYDARVAVSLNALQYIYRTSSGKVFNYIPGRNNVTGNTSKKLGFAYEPFFKKSNLIENLGWEGIKVNETYQTYLDLLEELRLVFKEYKLYDFEMALFSDAENLAKEAVKKSKSI